MPEELRNYLRMLDIEVAERVVEYLDSNPEAIPEMIAAIYGE